MHFIKNIILLVSVSGLVLWATPCAAEKDDGIYFERDKLYDITYQLNRYETATIRATRIMTPRKFGNGRFLILKKDRFGGDGRYAYLRMDHIIMIAETGFDPGIKSMKIESKGK